MQVIKRSGKFENVSLDKITQRIKKLCYGLDPKYIDPIKLAIKVSQGLYDKVHVQELDNLAAETAASSVTTHPDYAILAARIAVSNLHKLTEDDYLLTVKKLWSNIDKKSGEKAPLVSDKFLNDVTKNIEKIQKAINYDRDFEYDYFGYKTLERSYLLKSNDTIIERPQHLLMRVAIGIHGEDIDSVLESYELMSKKYFTHATPTLFNAGTPRPQLASCFLVANKGDNIEGLFETIGDVAKISKWAGGIGLHIHDVRAKGSYIKGTGGVSTGIIPMLKVYNEVARWIDQGSRRKGSFAIYLEPWHADIFEFLEIRKNQGKEELRARDLFTALWLSDIFMQRVENNENWSLFSPNEAPGLSDVYGEEFKVLYEKYEAEGKAMKTIKAQDLWSAILTSQLETGNPYMLYKDACNEKSNQKNIGVIKSSNLCVSRDTKILTENGYETISTLENKQINVWNGSEFSETVVYKTGKNQKLLKVKTNSGYDLKCTPYHKFYIQKSYNKNKIYEVEAKDLKKGDKLIKFELPIIYGQKDLFEAYTQGFFSGDGCIPNDNNDKTNQIRLYGEKKLLIDKIAIRNKYTQTGKQAKKTQEKAINYPNNVDAITVMIDEKLIMNKLFVPDNNYTVKSRLQWLAGICDSDGTLTNNNGTQSVQICSVEKEFLKEIQLMLQTLGCDSKLNFMSKAGYRLLPANDGTGKLKEYMCKNSYRLLINSNSLFKLMNLGFETFRLKPKLVKPNRECSFYIQIKSVKEVEGLHDTYCFNEPKKHLGMFNGILTGQCAEIIQVSNNEEVSVCNLASIGLPMFVQDNKFNFELLHKITKIAIKNLNKVIDVSYYPIPETEKSNKRHRPLGLGCQGLADVFFKLKLPYESDEARQLNKDIFETMYHAYLESSNELAILEGPYETFKGSPVSEGVFQFDMWGVTPNRYDWNKLKEKIVVEGIRNSLGLTQMPTASSSSILGNTEACEVISTNIGTRRVLSGDFISINKYLLKDLIDLNIWDENLKNELIQNNGSIQLIKRIPQNLKDIYKTAYEVKQRSVIDMSADRGAFICQSQSLNIFMESPSIAALTSMHFYGWKKKLKTGMYYLRNKAATEAVKFSISKPTYTEEEKLICSIDNKDDCVACSA